MPLKASQQTAGPAFTDRWNDGVGWIAHPEESMERCSHALAFDGDVWLVDPLDTPHLDEQLAEYGKLTGIIVLFDRHARDADTLARRHDVPVYAPPFLADSIELAVTDLDGELGSSGFEWLQVLNWPIWKEAALYDGETLVVPEAIGTAAYYRTAREHLGVHPMLRMTPPGTLRGLEPERILCGHGDGVFDGATPALTDALDNARRRLPEAWAGAVRSML